MMKNNFMKTPGYLKDPLFYLRILTTCTVLSTVSLMSSLVGSTSAGNTSGHSESLEVRLGELGVRATGKDSTEALMNLMKNARRSGISPLEELY